MRRALLCVAALLCAGCGGSVSHSRTFVARVDNPWFPLNVGTVWIYRGEKDGKPSRDVVRVLSKTRVIDGVRCTSVSDRLFEKGHLAERTTDWYAQDASGTVWYYGEATAELDAHGKVTSTEGSWLSGVHGARAGVFMPAKPRIGQSFRQEYLKGQAEDHFQIISIKGNRMVTKEWTPLEPNVLDHKTYVRGKGDVSEETVKGGSERATLISMRHR
jgi:hypothetical protein